MGVLEVISCNAREINCLFTLRNFCISFISKNYIKASLNHESIKYLLPARDLAQVF